MQTTQTRFKNLEKWEGMLAKCIRCGYCYEHCPMFKFTRWESDAPRGKNILAHGLLTGEIELTREIAEKSFSCFFCKRCEAACSSGVKITDIMLDLRRDLVELGYKKDIGTISTTDRSCARCLQCVRACPHDAREFVDGQGIVVDPVLCKSCGICVEICPIEAVTIPLPFGTDTETLDKRAAEWLNTHELGKAIVYACNWSYHPDIQNSKLPLSETGDKEYEILVNLCGGRIDKNLLLTPFLNKAWGVLVAVCPDGECTHDGNVAALQRVVHMKKTLESLDINPERIHLVQIPRGDKQLFQAEIDTFMEKLNQMGPIR
ncbi:hydrogenase iron-sulfur subunit [uncultured Desulfobacter sp.]|uniref:hydrogenase iron-sulfur subunit n=1 Tax=uncultured Desulfobacter sp. TaxID=240139 RepID=UPI002AAC16C2|nr:hydrogenase iron-sulfur subunit [uncultured Desulfobacter sp.]